jgi:hypothetical protein
MEENNNETVETLVEELQDKEMAIEKVKEIYESYKDEKAVVAQVAMNLSQKSSVYDISVGKSETMTYLLTELANSEDMTVRWAVAKNHHTPIDVLDKLAVDEINLVRALCATNPNTPTKHFDSFFHDEKIVRDGISGNINTPVKLLKILANDQDKMVRLRVADNPSCTQEILQKLVDDVEIDVQKASKIHLKERFDIEG